MIASSTELTGSREAVLGDIRAAQALMARDRPRALAMLNRIFRAGAPPDPLLDGRYAGELTALDIAPGLTPLFERIAGAWMPWKGKTFNAQGAYGNNMFTRDSLTVAHILWPFYRGYLDDGPAQYQAFRFRTYLAPGKQDPDRRVLKLDYDLAGNPRLSIRRVLDELVQVGDGRSALYLGKAHMHWWWGAWQLVAYFMLSETKG
jgi:hypothetical protein